MSGSPCPDEESLLAFVEGRRGAFREDIAKHLDGCTTCQDVVTAVAPGVLSGPLTEASDGPAPRSREPLARGSAIGRYVILSMLGRGGMGEVYAAYDPELDRRVALKLLHRDGGAESSAGRARMLREAKAIARLSHANVVVVHDAGTIDGRVFIAMEFVDGRTLAEWFKERPRAWREVRDVFVAAGRGLAAAHAAGLVHRDFKPQNVMIGHDGNVRVMDFGLASASVEDPATGPLDDLGLAGDSTAEPAAMALTRTGALLGTPAYMAPEQFRSEPADPSTDQFSFCVSLFEGLYGERPFVGTTIGELGAAVLAGKVRDPARAASVPAWLRRVVARGLTVAREGRHPSMAALLDALDDDPAVRRRRWGLGVGLALAAVGLAVGASKLGSKPRDLCGGGASRYAGIWEPAARTGGRRADIHRAFVAAGGDRGEEAFRSAARLLDDYVARWTSMYTDACEATNVRGEQSATVLDLRMGCLNERLGNVRALSDVFAAADAQIVEKAVSAAAALPGLDRCADLSLLRAVIKPPADAATRARVDELRTSLARLIAARDSGQCKRAIPAADALIKEVRAVRYQPLLAETLAAAAAIGNECGDPALLLERFKAAHTAAYASHHDEVAATASTQIVFYAVNRFEDLNLARVWIDVARGDVARLEREGFATGTLAVDEGEIALAEGQYDRALASVDRAIDIVRRVLGPEHPWTIMQEINKADWLERAGRLEEALALNASATAHFARVVGTDNAAIAIPYMNMGEVLNLLGRFAEAEKAYERALTVWRRTGADESFLGWGLTGLGRARLGLGKPEAALGPLQEALAIRVEKKAPPAQLGETRFNLARALWARPAERRRALAMAEAARAEVAGDEKARAEVDAWISQSRRQKI